MFIIDINECTDNTHTCHANAICTNTEGGYNCVCRSGHTGNGEVCTGTYLHCLFTNVSLLQHFYFARRLMGYKEVLGTFIWRQRIFINRQI